MSYWIREVVGWSLIALGLIIIAIAVRMLAAGHVWQTTPIGVLGIFVLRGGIHLVKVAMAARICERAAQALAEPPPRDWYKSTTKKNQPT